jgi:hypothetical protein
MNQCVWWVCIWLCKNEANFLLAIVTTDETECNHKQHLSYAKAESHKRVDIVR